MKLVSRIEIDKPEKVYNLHVKDDHNYVAQGAVVKNCHLAKADVLRKLLSSPGFAEIPLRWGMTGTAPPEKGDQLTLEAIVGPIEQVITAKELQEKGILANMHINIRQYQDSKPKFPDYTSEAQWLATDTVRMSVISDDIISWSNSGNTLVLVNKIATGELLESLIPGSIFLSGTDKSDKRTEQYRSLQEKDNQVLICTFGIASTGISINRIMKLVIVEGGRSPIKIIQSIGRGLRVAEDKDHVDVYDLCSNQHYSKKHLTERKKMYKSNFYPFSIKKIKY